ncbi:MAG: ABC transporter ATP-binding protein [Chloroflexota bacterium]
MNPIQLWWRMASFRPGIYAIQTSLYICYTLSLAFSGLILRAFFDRLADEPGALLLVAIISLQLGNTILAMVGLGGANAIGFYIYRHSIQAWLFGNIFASILKQPGAQPLPSDKPINDKPINNSSSNDRATNEAMSVGVALNTMRDDIGIVRYFDVELHDLLGFGLTAIIAFIAMFQVSIPITLGVFTPLIVIIYISNHLSERIERYRVASREAAGRATGAIGEIFGAVQSIQVNNAEERVLNHFRHLNEARRQASVRDQLLTRLVDALSENMVVIGTALVLILSAQAVQAGRFTVGDFALFVAYIWPVTALFRNIGGLIALYQQTGVSIRRLQTLMQSPKPTDLAVRAPIYLTGPLPQRPTTPKRADTRLERLDVQNLSYQYPLNGQGIHGVNLQIKRGTLTVITGRIGSGKTTLLRSLLGLLPKDSGEIRWNGKPVADPATFFVPPRSAYTPQTPQLFSETLRSNILLGLSDAGSDISSAIKQAILEPDVKAMDDGLDTLIGPRGMRLSGGQAQRTAAARMFVRGGPQGAELLVFDDLSSALDIETERLLWERLFSSVIDKRQERPTCLAVSHRQSVLKQADHIIVLKEGQVEDEGKWDELLERNRITVEPKG